MRAAVIRCVDRIDVTRADFSPVLADDGFDGTIHRTEMHRHMRRVGDQRAVAVEHRAGKIEPLLDIDRIGGVLQGHAHLLGNRHEEIVEHFEHDRIGAGADRPRPRQFFDPPQHQVILGGQLGLPTMLDHHGLMRLDDDRRAFHLVSRRQRFAQIDERAPPFTAGEEALAARRRRQLRAFYLVRGFFEARAAAHGFDGRRLEHQRFFAVDKAEARFVRPLEGGFYLG